jgi:RNA polymerase sigma-B factor
MSDDENSEATAPAGRLGDDDDGFDLIEMKLSVATALDRLPHLERQAVRLRMGGDLKQSEIAEQMNCSQMQISRLLRRAAEHLHADMSPAAR